MKPDFTDELRILVRALRIAAPLCRRVQSGIGEVLHKEDRSPATVADYGVQALICRILSEHFPADGIVAEEDAGTLREEGHRGILERVVRAVRSEGQERATERDVCQWIDLGQAEVQSDRAWTLDPIDGTKGFLRGEQYAVSLALVVNGMVEVGGLACPRLSTGRAGIGEGALFTAVRGGGAAVTPLFEDGPAHALTVSRRGRPEIARMCESVEAGHSAHDESAAVARRLGIEAPSVRMDSQAKYAVLAQGNADIYLRLPTDPRYQEKIWDHAAGFVIVSEAGGRVTDIEGRELDFTQGRTLGSNRGIVATNGLLHGAVLAALGPD